MSDRFVLDTTQGQAEELFQVSTERGDFFEPQFNITPGSQIPVVYRSEGEREIYNFIWGMIPKDASSETDGRDNFELPLNQIGEEGEVYEALAQRRCLILANGFYKWKSTEKKNTPFYIRLLSNKVTAFAGIYSVWEAPSGREVYSCTMLTQPSNALVQPVDDRMPILINPDDFDWWLSEDKVKVDEVESYSGYGLTKLAVNRVSEGVNDVTNNSAELIQPIPK